LAKTVPVVEIVLRKLNFAVGSPEAPTSHKSSDYDLKMLSPLCSTFKGKTIKITWFFTWALPILKALKNV
jgi:hypothetical protein